MHGRLCSVLTALLCNVCWPFAAKWYARAPKSRFNCILLALNLFIDIARLRAATRAECAYGERPHTARPRAPCPSNNRPIRTTVLGGVPGRPTVTY